MFNVAHKVILVTLFLVVTNWVSATPVQWTLNNVMFEDGAIATGSFVYDTSLGHYSSIMLTISGGSAHLNNYGGLSTDPFIWGDAQLLAFSGSMMGFYAEEIIDFTLPTKTTRNYVIQFGSLPGSGGAVGVTPGIGESFVNEDLRVGTTRAHIGGSLSGIVLVPEPAITGLMCLAIGMIAARRKRLQ